MLAELETQLGLRIQRAEPVRRGPNSHVYALRSEAGTFFLKLRVDSFSRARVAEEAALLEFLNARGFNAPRLVRSASGEALLECTLDGARVCGYLTEEVPIAEPRIDLTDRDQLRSAAHTLAELHTLTDSLPADFTVVTWDDRALIDRNLALLQPLLAARKLDALRRTFERVKERTSRAWHETEGAWGIVHGDCHAGNVARATNGQLWFLDYESFGNGWRIHDVLYLVGDPGDTEGRLDLDVLRDRYAAFMDEYSRVGPTLGDEPDLPLSGLAVRLLLNLGRRVQLSQRSGSDAASRTAWLDVFLRRIDQLQI